MRKRSASYSEAAKFLEVQLHGVPDSQFLEIRTIKKGGAKKRFYR